jgi:hypothetical protein
MYRVATKPEPHPKSLSTGGEGLKDSLAQGMAKPETFVRTFVSILVSYRLIVIGFQLSV